MICIMYEVGDGLSYHVNLKQGYHNSIFMTESR